MPEDALAEDAFPDDGLGSGGDPISLARALCEPEDGGLFGRDEGAPERFLESRPSVSPRHASLTLQPGAGGIPHTGSRT